MQSSLSAQMTSYSYGAVQYGLGIIDAPRILENILRHFV